MLGDTNNDTNHAAPLARGRRRESKKKHQTEAEFQALQTWYHGLKNTEAGLWRVLRCAIDLPSLQFNDITTCFRKPKETLMQLA